MLSQQLAILFLKRPYLTKLGLHRIELLGDQPSVVLALHQG